MKQKTILIIGAGIEQVPVIIKAKKMGLLAIASDINPKAIGFKYSDYHFMASTYDINQTVREALKFNRTHRKINGVMTMASDVPLTVASVAKSLSLPGNSIETAMIAQDKLLMKEHFKKNGVPIPWYTKIRNKSDLKKTANDKGFPLVIKPVDSRGARGVLLLTKNVDLEWAYYESQKNSPTKRVMVEEFLEGPQISTESFLYDGFSVTPGIADRNYRDLKKFIPYIIENGGELPSNLPEAEQVSIKKIAELAASVLGIKRNSAKGDLVLTKEGPKVIEIAARLSGGYFSTHEIPLNTGVDLVEAVIKVSLGEKIELEKLTPKYKNFMVQRYFFPKPGVIKSIKGVDKIKKLPFLILFRIYVKPGDTIKKIENHTERAGVFTVVGETRTEAFERSKKIINSLMFTMN